MLRYAILHISFAPIHIQNTETLQSMHFLGCLFVLLFGAIFLLFAFSRYILGWLYDTLMFRIFGIKPPRKDSRSNSQSSTSSTYRHSTSAGNAHHESQSDSSSSRPRSGKIFSQDEGTYVDFEEIKS